MSKRQDRPNAIAWLLKHHPELSDAQLCKLIGTTKPTIGAIRDRTHWNAANLKAQNPVTLGLCSEADLEKEVALAPRRAAPTPAAGYEDAPVEAEAPPTRSDKVTIPSFLADGLRRPTPEDREH